MTYAQVNLAWIFFRANSVEDAGWILSSIFSGSWSYSVLRQELVATGGAKLDFLLSLFFIGFLLLVDATRHMRTPFPAKLIFYVGILMSVFLFGVDTSESFIYFQF